MRLDRLLRAFSLFKALYGGYKKQIAVLIVLGFLSGFLDGVGIGMLIPLFSVVTGKVEAGSDQISKLVENLFSYFDLSLNVPILLLLMSTFFIFKAISLWLFGYIDIKIASDYEVKTRSDLYRKTFEAAWPYLLKQKIGYLENTLMTDMSFAVVFFRRFAATTLYLTNFLVYIVMAFAINSYITILTLGSGLLMFIVAQPLIARTKKYSTQRNMLNKLIAHKVNENVPGFKVIKSLGAENGVAQEGYNLFEKLRNIRVKIFAVKNTFVYSTQAFSLIFILGVFGLSYQRPEFNLAAFAAVIYLIQRIFAHIEDGQKSLHAVGEAIPHLENIIQFMSDLDKFHENVSGKENFNFKDELRFSNVSFSYESREAVSAISFFAKRGEMVGIIGPSGAGKTTVVDLLLRLFKPISGNILIDDVNISDITLADWRKNLGYVSQDIFLKNDTIANNIKFYDQSISDAGVIEAAKTANAFNFIQKLPEGFNTIVGERGIHLSGGERQRIALARVLARKPQILVLDEATSSLDNESEVLIKEALKKLKGKVTIISIAHRLSTVREADRLIVIDGGRIKEDGNPEDLLKNKNSYFYKLYNIA